MDDARARAAALVEAVVPVLAVQAWVWAAGHPRARAGDALLAVGLVGWLLLCRRRARAREDPAVRSGTAGWHAPDVAPAHEAPTARGSGRFRRAAGALALPVTGLVVLLLAGGAVSGALVWRPSDLARALLLYPLSGALQQGLVFGFLEPRVRRALGERATPAALAVLFGLAHLPNPVLTAGGALMVLVFARVWRRTPSLPALALAHGLLGAVADKALTVSMRIGAGY